MKSAATLAWVACIASTSLAIIPPVDLHRNAKQHTNDLRRASDKEDLASASPSAALGVTLMQASLRHSNVQLSDSAESTAASHTPADPAESDVAADAPLWATEEEKLPVLEDSLLSGPALLAYMVRRTAVKLINARIGTSHRNQPQPLSLLRIDPDTDNSYVSDHWVLLLFALLGFTIGVIVIWFNELRSVKMDTLLSRGLSECESIEDGKKLGEETLGCLVHVRGQTVAAVPVEDTQFQNAVVHNCLKLQSTVEVYEWVQTVKINQTGNQVRDARNQIQYTFHKEWTTVHRNSLQFQRSVGKPSPDNPRPPRGLSLGTFTSVCRNVQLCGFTLPDDMTEQFGKFKPAMQYLPPTVQACGLVFYANKDGYFYARPTMRSMWSSKGGPSVEPMVGDVRVRFLCVPQADATAVAVHCEMGGVDTFVPYRAIPRGCCTNETRNRQRLIEEGARSLQEVKEADQNMTPCITRNRMLASCFCCPCSTIQACTKEVVTEEIYYISEELDPIEKPFNYVVPRNHCRVWMFRALGWLMCYLTCMAVVGSFKHEALIKAAPVLRVYGSWAPAVLAAIIATSSSAFVISIAYLCYSLSQSLKWVCAVGVVILLPYVVGQARMGII